MAGASLLKAAPYPSGGGVIVALGGYVPNALTAAVIGAFNVPWDCWVKSVSLYYKGGTAHLDAITLTTVDDSKDLIAAFDGSADISGVKQTLDTDIVGYQIQAGDVIKLLADSTDADESGWLMAYVELVPIYSHPIEQ